MIQDQAEIDITPLPLYIQQQLRILMKPRKQRAELDNLSLVPLLQQVKFFKERSITTDVLQRIARLAQHEFVRAERVVFKQGSVGDKLYVVIDGEVSINLRNEDFISLRREIQTLCGQVSSLIHTVEVMQKAFLELTEE